MALIEVRVNVDEQFIENLRNKTGEKSSKIVLEALSMFNWAINEKENERVILSTNKDGGSVKQLSMPILDRIIVEAPSVV